MLAPYRCAGQSVLKASGQLQGRDEPSLEAVSSVAHPVPVQGVAYTVKDAHYMWSCAPLASWGWL